VIQGGKLCVILRQEQIPTVSCFPVADSKGLKDIKRIIEE